MFKIAYFNKDKENPKVLLTVENAEDASFVGIRDPRSPDQMIYTEDVQAETIFHVLRILNRAYQMGIEDKASEILKAIGGVGVYRNG